MEKTKKLFAYVVVFVAIVSLFIAGISVNNTLTYAGNSTTYEGEITKVDGATKLDGTPVAATEIALVFFNDKATVQQKSGISQAETEVAQADLSKAVLDKIDEIAKAIAKDDTVTHEAIVYEKPFMVEVNDNSPVKVTFSTKDIADGVDFILFKSKATGAWSVIEPETAANAAMNAGGSDSSITVRLPGSGTVVFGHYSQAKADEIKAGKGGNDACCTCCNKNCPFCSFLCKDGKCYCWTMYVVIALCAIFIVLVVVLIVVKSKKKKAIEAQPVEEIEEETEKKPEEENK